MSLDRAAGDATPAQLDASERDPSADVRRQFRVWALDQARSMVSDDLIAEFNERPIGQHSDGLERLLTWLRMVALLERDVLIVLEDGSYAIGRIPANRGGVTRVVDEFRSYSHLDAEREVFRRRIAALQSS